MLEGLNFCSAGLLFVFEEGEDADDEEDGEEDESSSGSESTPEPAGVRRSLRSNRGVPGVEHGVLGSTTSEGEMDIEHLHAAMEITAADILDVPKTCEDAMRRHDSKAWQHAMDVCGDEISVGCENLDNDEKAQGGEHCDVQVDM